MKKQKKYSGIVVPMITPLTSELRLDEKAVERMVHLFRRHNIMPFILGTTGESASLPLSLKKEFIRLLEQLKRPGDTWYAGIASNCFEDSVKLADYCFEHGIDAVAAHLPSYYSLSNSSIKGYFEALADATQGPLIIYNIPSTTHMSIPVDILDQLSHHSNIVGVKDSERSEGRLKQSLALWSQRADFSYFLGWAAQSAYALLRGADGLIPSTGNLLPQIYSEMLSAVLENDQAEVLLRQHQSDVLGNLYQGNRLLGDSLWALKVLMEETGLCQSYVMPPLQRGSAQEAAELKEAFHQLINRENIKLDEQYV